MEELLASAGSVKFPVENKAGDSAILKVVEAYCAGGRGAIRKLWMFWDVRWSSFLTCCYWQFSKKKHWVLLLR